MKRSEAAALIKEKLTGVPMDANWVYVILDTVESIGMQPPPVQTDIFLRSENDFAWANVWEEE